MGVFQLKAGDLEQSLVVQLLDAEDQGVDVSAATGYTLRWRAPDGTISEADLVAVTDGSDGRLTRAWSAGETDQEGTYYAEVLVDWSGKTETFPSEGSFRWTVYSVLS